MWTSIIWRQIGSQNTKLNYVLIEILTHFWWNKNDSMLVIKCVKISDHASLALPIHLIHHWCGDKHSSTLIPYFICVLLHVQSQQDVTNYVYESTNAFYALISLTKSTSRSFSPTSMRLLASRARTRLGKLVVISNSSGDCGWLNTKSYRSCKQ